MGAVWTQEWIESARQEIERAEPPHPSLAAEGWLAQSLQDPPPLAALLRVLGAHRTPWKSHAAQGIDLFSDLVLRSGDLGQELLRGYSERAGWRSLSLGELRARSARLATAWARCGVKAGQRIAIVLPLSAEYVVALLTALRLGLCACPMPPRGALLMRRRLERLAPDLVYTTALYAPLLQRLPEVEERLLLDEPVGMAMETYFSSHTYAPEDPALLLFDPHREPAESLTAVPSGALLTALALDVLFTFAAGPGQVVAAPGALPEQLHPTLPLVALLGRLGCVHIELDALRRNPLLLGEAPITHLLVSGALRDLLTQLPRGLLPRLRCLFRDPLHAGSLGLWQRMIAAQGWGRVPIANLVYSSAVGGSLLLSGRTRGVVTMELLPAPGRPCTLQAPDEAQRPAQGGAGTFVRSGDKDGFVVLGRADERCALGGTLTPRRDGLTYPQEAALAAIGDLPFVDGAAVALQPRDDGSEGYILVLVVLCGAEEPGRFEGQRHERQEALRQRLRSQLDEELLPDRISLFPLLAPRAEGAVETARIAADYRSGELHRKARDPRLHTLHRLVRAVRETPLFRMQVGAPCP